MQPARINWMRWLAVVGAWMLAVGVPAGLSRAAGLVGGPCAYVDYPGKATIVAVTAQQRAGNDVPGLEVTFTFVPDAPITDDRLYEPGRTYPLTLTGGQAPGPRFVAKHDLRPGRALPCRLRTIRQGTCTPVLFDFPGIDLTDDPDRR